MLERATACIKSGAARDTLRCAHKAPRSKRMLHSTFWNHGAGALELPLWALSMHPMPSDLPLKHDSTVTRQAKSRSSMPLDVAPMSHPTPDGLFLDFLYPPQALAWLQRTSVQQQLQRWEKRNVRRLPEGFVVASRGYASRSYQPFAVAEDEIEEQVHEEEDNDVKPRPYEQHSSDNNASESNSEQGASKANNAESSDYTFADSPGELAETLPNRVQMLRQIITTRSKSLFSNPDKSRELAQRVWEIFESFDQDTRDDSRLKQELLDWLALHHNAIADSHCEELYHSIPAQERTLQVYAATLSIFLRRKQFASASKLHNEALHNLENGHLITKTLFGYAVEHQRWQLAIQTAMHHHAVYAEMNQPNQIRVFWLHVSEMPRLIEKAVRLARYLAGIKAIRPADNDTRSFCAKFFKEAILQQFLRPDEDPQSTTTWEQLNNNVPPHYALRRLFGHIADMDKDAPRFFEDTLMAMLRRDSRIKYGEYHTVISYMYREYRKMSGVHPPRRLLSAFLWQLTRYEKQRRSNWESDVSVGIQSIVKDWEFFHRKLDKEAVAELLTYYATTGTLEKVEHWLKYLQSVYPNYKDQKDLLWTMIYIHARRDDLDKAQQAFAEIKRIAAENGDEPDLKCWNNLLHAHSRADDLEGAFTNFHNLIDYAKLKPDNYSFNPLLSMLARRGDVEGVEDLTHQYDQIVKEKRNTIMIAHLMNAHINNDNLKEADSVLRETISKVRNSQILGSTTPCFNVLMSGYASRRNIDAVMQTYQWMKQEETSMDGDSFGALIQVLTHYRQTDSACKILMTVMPEHNVEPTAFHYGIVMLGLVHKRMYVDTLKLHARMSRQNVRPSIATNVAYLRARAYMEHEEKKGETTKEGEPVPLETSIKDLQAMMRSHDGEEMALKQSKLLVGTPDRGGAKTAAYFETLISLHGQRRCLEAVQDLLRQYKEAAKERGDDEEIPPLRILSALMSAHWHGGEYDKVEEYWKLAKQQADDIAPPVPVPSYRYYFTESSLNVDPLDLQPSETYPAEDTDRRMDASDHTRDNEPASKTRQTLLTDKSELLGRRPAPNRRQILNGPLRFYLAALDSQSRMVDAITTVSRLLAQGYTLNMGTWNYFIQCILNTTPPLALLAFKLTEKFLIQQFPGWLPMRKHGVSPQARQEGLQHIRARYLRRDQAMPTYKTLVRLGAAMLDIRRLEALGRRGLVTDVPPELQRLVGTTKEIRSQAAKTLFAVQSMPVIADRWQAKYLRREES